MTDDPESSQSVCSLIWRLSIPQREDEYVSLVHFFEFSHRPFPFPFWFRIFRISRISVFPYFRISTLRSACCPFSLFAPPLPGLCASRKQVERTAARTGLRHWD